MVTLTTQQKILEIAKKEFLEKGFKDASLRKIVTEAGFTVGAFYGYYSSKEALFNAIVAEPAKILLDTCIRAQRNFSELPTSEQLKYFSHKESAGDINWFITYVYDHFEVFKLIFCRSAGTAYESYLDRLMQTEIEDANKFILALKNSGHQLKNIDDNLVHILVSIFYAGIVEVFDHDMPRASALEYIKKLHEFYNSGWAGILGL